VSDENRMDVKDSILETIGNTPLVRFRRVGKGIPADLLAKVEFMNPGGSVKDRIGLAMIRDAEARGKLAAGGTVVECTSGNTGMGLAVASAVLGYRSVFTMPDKMSLEKINLLKAMGAEVVVTPTAVPPDSPESYYKVAERIVRDTPGAHHTNQYYNEANPKAHYETTGPEIWRQSAGRVTHFVAGLGTGGTISGVGRYLKEQNPKIRIIGVDPDGSILAEYFRTQKMGEGHPYKVEGIGEDIIPGTTHFQHIDEMVTVTDKEAFLTTRRIAREEGMLVGGSCGAAVAGALKALERTTPEDVAVVLLPDTGERYLSKIFNDAWMRDNGYLEPGAVSLKDVLAVKGRETPALITVEAGRHVHEAIDLVRRHDISVIPVVENGAIAGTLNENALMRLVLEDPKNLDRRAGEVMEAPLPKLNVQDDVQAAIRVLSSRNPAVLVYDGERAVGILTRIDVIGFVSQ
jgi:cystathionine beta-synthase